MKFKIYNDDEGVHEYTVKVKAVEQGKQYTLKYSKNEIWSNHYRGRKALRVVDTGNGLSKINYYNGVPDEDCLDYADFVLVSILFNFIRQFDNSVSPNYRVHVDLTDLKCKAVV